MVREKTNLKIIDDPRTFLDFQLQDDTKTTENIIGFIIYVLVFVISLPILFYKYKYFGLLESYLPNLDLIANILSFHGGPKIFHLFKHLYVPVATTSFSFFSQTAINYMALLGVTYLIARETKLTNSIYKGWSIAFVMLLVTYLLPASYISELMDRTNKFLSNIHPKEIDFNWNISILIGIIATIFVILFEKFLITNTRDTLEKISKYVIHFPKFIL